MTFDELLTQVGGQTGPGVCVDSRLVRPGDIFVAVRGTEFDGHDFIDKALASGAKYIVCQRARTMAQHISGNTHEEIVVEDSAVAAGLLAQASRGWPCSKLTNLAVTGTNGKTTVTYLVRSIVQTAGYKCGLIGTVTYDTGLASSAASLTTPDCLTIAEAQREMVKAGAKFMVLEASSHALSQNRLAGVDFRAAAFTNLTGDHLDYHKTEENYLAAKSLLFEQLNSGAFAVLNKQSPQAEKIAKKTKAQILWYAVGEPADITAQVKSMDAAGSRFVLKYARQEAFVQTPLLGYHNISNHLAAAGLCLAAGLDLQTVAKGLSALKSVPGRLEKVEHKGDFAVLVDYAHTDDALKNVLVTLRPLCKGKLITVFGCGGDRDRSKRPRMAAVVQELADVIIVTSDNPRTEEPGQIIKEILAGFKKGDSKTVFVEPDRKTAIGLAIEKADTGDIVLIAGKGHETYQIIGKTKIDFCDKAIAAQFLNKKR